MTRFRLSGSEFDFGAKGLGCRVVGVEWGLEWRVHGKALDVARLTYSRVCGVCYDVNGEG